MVDDESEFKTFREIVVRGAHENQIRAGVGCYPSFRLVTIQVGPEKGHYGSDRAVPLTRSEAVRLAEWILANAAAPE